MRAVVQRVCEASVEVDGIERASIGPGLLVLVGILAGDGERESSYLADKLVHLRIFSDDASRMNRSVLDSGGEMLIVPNFTLAGDARKGRRPSFDGAMSPELAEPMFVRFCDQIESLGMDVARGVFRAHMRVRLLNDGPVTLVLDSIRQ